MRPKGSAEALEMRRMIAARLLQAGKGIREVAWMVGASHSSVLKWKRAMEQGGMEALKARPHPGRRPRLTEEQKRELAVILLIGPLAAGFPTDLWTLKRVAVVIERHFGVKCHPGYGSIQCVSESSAIAERSRCGVNRSEMVTGLCPGVEPGGDGLEPQQIQ
jgi:transposase